MDTAGLNHVTAVPGAPGGNVAVYTDALGLPPVERTNGFEDTSTPGVPCGDGTARGEAVADLGSGLCTPPSLGKDRERIAAALSDPAVPAEAE